MIWMDVDTALSEVPVNYVALIDDTDFKTREESVTYDQAGMDLVWNFVTTAGSLTQTAVTPTTGGVHDWTNQGNGMYTIEIPASGGTINNDTEGFGWFTGFATGILPWSGPVIGFRAAGLNNKIIDDAYDTYRGLAGTGVPAAAADAAGGLPISDAGGLDLDTKLANTNEVTAARMEALTDWINGGRLDLILDIIAADVVNLDGAAMRGTDGAALASAWTATRAGYIDLLNTYLDAAITSRLSSSGYTAPDNTNIGNINTIVSSGTYGLSALKTLIDTIDTVVDTISGKIIGTLASGTHTAQSADNNTILASATYGLSALKTLIDVIDGIVDTIVAKTNNLPSGIKKGVALNDLEFVMLLTSDHATGATGLTVTGQIAKDGGSFASVTGSITEKAYGVYNLDTLTATEMNADIVTLRFTGTGADDRIIVIKTVE